MAQIISREMIENDFNFQSQVYQIAAGKLQIEDYEWKSLPELKEEIEMAHPTIAQLIAAYIKAYGDWADADGKHESACRGGNGSTALVKEREQAIERRNRARKSLISAVS